MNDVKLQSSDSIKKKDWHPQQSKLLKNWAEIASSYRWMHNQAYMIYKKKNMWFMLPLIVMSTVTGTANFAQSTFPESIRPYVPQIIGAINLISAIMTTIYQFLKISEFMECHRISSINYGKLARTITVELNLPVKDRNSGGAECVKTSRNEIDRLIEQSPAIPKNVLYFYKRQFSGKGLSEPEIVVINKVDVYEDKENNVATVVSDAGVKFKNALQKIKKPLFLSESPIEKRKENVNLELNTLQKSKLVSMINTSAVTSILNRFSPTKRETVKPPEFPQIPENLNVKTKSASVTPESVAVVSSVGPITILPTHHVILNDGTDLEEPTPEEQLAEDLDTDKILEEIAPGVGDELEQLRTIKIVSSFKNM